MTPQSSTSTTSLNPLAPEYNPIPSGVTPSHNATSSFFLPSLPFAGPCPPSSSSSLQLRPPTPPPPTPPAAVFLSPLFYTYTASQQPLQTYYSTYPVTPQRTVSANPPPVPPSRVEVVTRYGQTGRGSTRRRGCRGGRESFRSSTGHEKNVRKFSLNFEKRSNDEKNSVRLSTNERKISTHGIQKEENRHEVMPLKRDEENTTVMIKNIPYDCRRKELIALLDEFCLVENEKAKNEGTSKKEAEELFTCAYDFVYLPIDFISRRSRGFAFVNFTNARSVWKFFDVYHLTKWDFVAREKWSKNIEIVSAKIQGKEALVSHFRESVFECETDEFLPACFSPPRDGSKQLVELIVAGNRCAPPRGAAAGMPKPWYSC